jgi:hypothetical protein
MKQGKHCKETFGEFCFNFNVRNGFLNNSKSSGDKRNNFLIPK